MSIDATRWAWQQTGISTTEKIVLLSMADRAGENHDCWPSIERLCIDTLLKERAVQKAIKALEEKGIIKVEQRHSKTNKYALVGVNGREDVKSCKPSQPNKTHAPSAESCVPDGDAPHAPRTICTPHNAHPAPHALEPRTTCGEGVHQVHPESLRESFKEPEERQGACAPTPAPVFAPVPSGAQASPKRAAPKRACSKPKPTAPPSQSPGSPPTPPAAKTPHGEHGHVLLTTAEHARLMARYGREWTQEAIVLLDLHISAGGKDKYVSHCAALQKWVFDAVNERRLKLRMPPFTQSAPPQRREAQKPQPYDHEPTPEELARNRQAAQKARQQYFQRHSANSANSANKEHHA